MAATDAPKKPRSIAQHRRFFAVVAAAFDHWPHGHAFQPDSAEHLRAWLLVRAKHCVIKTFHLTEDATELARVLPVITAIMLGKHSWTRANGNELLVCVPMSIAFDAVGHNEFGSISATVGEIIRSETGLDPDVLLKETETAA